MFWCGFFEKLPSAPRAPLYEGTHGSLELPPYKYKKKQNHVRK
jgi:hypothetical protein